MNEVAFPGFGLNEETVAEFAGHLESFAATLSDRERASLRCLLTSALDPWEKMRLRDPNEILSPDEAEVLRALEAEGSP